MDDTDATQHGRSRSDRKCRGDQQKQTQFRFNLWPLTRLSHAPCVGWKQANFSQWHVFFPFHSLKDARSLSCFILERHLSIFLNNCRLEHVSISTFLFLLHCMLLEEIDECSLMLSLSLDSCQITQKTSNVRKCLWHFTTSLMNHMLLMTRTIDLLKSTVLILMLSFYKEDIFSFIHHFKVWTAHTHTCLIQRGIYYLYFRIMISILNHKVFIHSKQEEHHRGSDLMLYKIFTKVL